MFEVIELFEEYPSSVPQLRQFVRDSPYIWVQKARLQQLTQLSQNEAIQRISHKASMPETISSNALRVR
jgi:hypothetical protein